MARKSVFYKGRRKKKNYAIIPFVILLLLFSVTLVLFYGMQKYAVISDTGVSIELPILTKGQTVVNSEGEEVRVFETVEATLQFDAPDYSHVEPTAGSRLSQVRAIFVPAANLSNDKLDEYVARLNTGNALVLEMKPRSGICMWSSQSPIALNYGLVQDTETARNMPEIIAGIKARKVYLAAQISCCLDELFASRSTTVTLRTETGMNYSDSYGLWLDPYNMNLRSYISDLVGELFALGFDEVVLADVMHPVLAEGVNLVYTRRMSTAPSTVNAVCGFALSIANDHRDRSGQLSIYLNTAPALVKADTTTGQDGPFFTKIFDRIYYPTDKYAYTYNLEDIKLSMQLGDPLCRFVPVVQNYLPDNAAECSWVLVDVAEEED